MPQRKYLLNIPQLLCGGMSENWMLKELGDIHWVMISESLGARSDSIVDSNGERLYASFVRLQWRSNQSLYEFKENDAVEMDGALSLYGNKMVFSDTSITCGAKEITSSLMSVFSSRASSDNEQLTKGVPLDSEKAKAYKHKKLPGLAKGYFAAKSYLFSDLDQRNEEDNKISFCDRLFTLRSEALFSRSYTVDPYDDINGVGLLYFASYSKINDKCERFYFQEHHIGSDKENNWAANSFCVARDIHYYGNANADEELLYTLDNCHFIEADKLQLTSSLYRAKDGQLIAKLFTIKQLLVPVSLVCNLEANHNTKSVVTPLTTITDKKLQIGKLQKADPTTLPVSGTVLRVNNKQNVAVVYSREELTGIITGFFALIFDKHSITATTDLRQLGVESVVFMELSEYLHTKYHIQNNPGRFYGLSTVTNIVSYLLGQDATAISMNGTLQSKAGIALHEKTIASDEIVIVGISLRFPGATTKEQFWELLATNGSAIGKTPEDRWIWSEGLDLEGKHKGVNYGGYISDINKFDASFFSISPQEARLMDPQQRITLEAAYAALEDAGIAPNSLQGSSTGVFIGVSGSDYSYEVRDAHNDGTLKYDSIGTAPSILANRISYMLDLHGPNQVIDTACSSSLVAIHEAVRHIKDGSCEVAIAGGVNAMLRPELTLSYYHSGMLSEDGACKSFDQSANGYVRSEGVGIVVLKSLSKALADRDPVYGIVKSSFVNHGGKANTLTSPNPEAHKALLIKAYDSSDVDPRQVSYIEAHGTGTPLGDPIEIEGLKLAFEALYNRNGLGTPATSHCGIGSVKANIGHLEAAAGVAGVFKVLLSMKYKKLPGNPNLKTPNAYIDLEGSPFYLRKETTPWEIEKGHKRIAGVSSFGFGGVNTHIVLSEYSEKEQSEYLSKIPALIPLSARTKDRLKERVSNLIAYLKANEETNLYDVAFTLQLGRDAMEERLAVVADSIPTLIKQLTTYLEDKTKGLIMGAIKDGGQGFMTKDAIQTAIREGKLERLAQLWVEGTQIDWYLLHKKDDRPKKIHLPSYPFAGERYWIEKTASENSNQPDIKKTSISEFIINQVSTLVSVDTATLDRDEFISDYGVDSIGMTHLASAINTAFNLDIRPLELQSYLTIRELSDFIDGQLEQSPFPDQSLFVKKQPEINEDLKSVEDMAIIGLDLEIPGANSLEGLNALLEAEQYNVSGFPENRWKGLPDHYTQGLSPEQIKGKFLENALGFDHKLFKVSVREAMLMDPQQRLLLQSVWRAIENAGYTRKEFAKKRTGVYVAINGVDYSDIVKYDPQVDEFSGRGVKRYISANRISNFFNLAGISETIDTACSSFFVGVKKAVDAIRDGTCDQAVVCGVQVNLLPFTFLEQSAQGILTDTNRTLPFDTEASGYIRSEGLGSIILKKGLSAEQDKDHIYACIKGSGVAHGGRSLNITSPNVASHKQAFMAALEDSGTHIDEILAIETHGTGMPLGDQSEIQAFNEVFAAKERAKTPRCALGAAKSMLGHLEAASGALAIMKSILSLDRGKIHGIKGMTSLHPKCDLSSFVISESDQPLGKAKNSSGTIGLHSYGIGGVSAFLLLEEAKDQPTFKLEGEVKRIFVLSGQSEFTLYNYVEQVHAYLLEHSGKSWFDPDHFLASYQLNREVMSIRLAIVADGVEDLIDKLAHFKNNVAANSVYGSPSLYLPKSEKQASGLNELAKYWVKEGEANWGITSLSRFPYPVYPMDSRRSFWIAPQKNTLP